MEIPGQIDSVPMVASIPPNLHLGTSSWSTTDWYGVFYPPDLEPNEFIGYYAERYPTVEVDATFYRQPSMAMVENWDHRTPAGFIFSAKVPQVITHEKGLVDCQGEISQFLRSMSTLGDKLGPLLFQFPYISRKKAGEEYRTGEDFLRRLRLFLETLPTSDYRFAVEVRNSHWIKPSLVDLLKEHGISLAVSCYYTMPSIDQMMKMVDLVTADFFYIRFLGHHQHIEKLIDRLKQDEGKEKAWNELVIDRTQEMTQWIGTIRELAEKKLDVYVYFNNHYAGFAPGSVELFKQLWSGDTERWALRDFAARPGPQR